ncbi:MAG: YolD-like family protein [Eubacterium sp.]|nr:YolD-like family protein [Eubacterium sp.]
MHSPHKKTYDDIIHLPRHVSKTHPHMPIADRAAQFSPFAALTGHHEAIKEAGRMTSQKISLDENAKSILDQKLQMILERPSQEITLTYFLPDPQKDGGAYIDYTGVIKKADTQKRLLIMEDHTAIPIDDIIDLRGQLLS